MGGWSLLSGDTTARRDNSIHRQEYMATMPRSRPEPECFRLRDVHVPDQEARGSTPCLRGIELRPGG